MKKSLRIAIVAIAVLTAAVLVRFSALGHASETGQAPGLVTGNLAPCPEKPNCVCSEFADDAAHYVAPLDFSGASPESAWREIRRVIEELGGEVAVVDGEYLAATFTSSLFGFVDDVECRLNASQQQIQIRSASRVGYSDFGVNRKRVQAITRSFEPK